MRLWTTSVDVTFEAADAEEATRLAGEIAGRCLIMEEVWAVEGYFEPGQTTQPVDGIGPTQRERDHFGFAGGRE